MGNASARHKSGFRAGTSEIVFRLLALSPRSWGFGFSPNIRAGSGPNPRWHGVHEGEGDSHQEEEESACRRVGITR